MPLECILRVHQSVPPHLPCSASPRHVARPLPLPASGEREQRRAVPHGVAVPAREGAGGAAKWHDGATHTLRAILPIWTLDSIRACASTAWRNAKTLSMTGRTLPATISGQTLRSTARAMDALSV